MASRAFKIHSRQVRATSALEWPVSQSFLHWFSTPDREQSRPLSTALAETGPSHWRASRSRAGPQGKESPSMTPTRSTACPAFRSRDPAAFLGRGMPSGPGSTSKASVVPPDT